MDKDLTLFDGIVETLKSHNASFENHNELMRMLSEKVKFLEQRVYSLESKLLNLVENARYLSTDRGGSGKNRFDL